MIDALLLRFDAPLMSFGRERVDQYGYSGQFPGTSLLTGLLGNALGWDHRDAECLQRLQERLVHAARQDRAGSPLRDYQTVDLGRDHMLDTNAWTTRGRRDRRGGAAATTTHQRFQDYFADAVYTVALTLQPYDERPRISELAEALRWPARPLFIGRKACLPSVSILIREVRAEGILAALAAEPCSDRAGAGRLLARWPAGEPLLSGMLEQESQIRKIWDLRDWHDQIHSGHRMVREGLLPACIEEANHA